jgi:hypothetical protein
MTLRSDRQLTHLTHREILHKPFLIRKLPGSCIELLGTAPLHTTHHPQARPAKRAAANHGQTKPVRLRISRRPVITPALPASAPPRF